MTATSLATAIAQLTEPASIALARSLEFIPLATPLSSVPVTTAYVRQGTGKPPILLLHGFDSSVLEFRKLLPLLTAEHEVWAIDSLGFGFTDRPVGIPFTPAAIKAHLYAFWKTLIQQPVILVGASMGGAIAIDFALTYPDAVQQLVLIDSAGFAAGPNMGKFMVPPLGYLAAEFLRHPAVRRKVSLQAYVDASLVTPDALLCTALHLNCPRWREAMIDFTKSGGYNFLSQKISQIHQPTLILWGENDRILGTKDAERFKQAISRSQLIWIENCGHVPHLEKPQTIANVILQILKKL